MSWEYVTLDKLGSISRGRSKHRPRNDKALFGGKYPFVQTADVKAAELYLTDYKETYNERGLEQSKLWKEGTLCITIAANIADTAILGIRICVSILPMVSAVIAYLLLKRFKMTKDDHTMIRAAIATKHKYGTVTLNDYERERCELLSGYKLEEIWIGKDNEQAEKHTLDRNENGEYLILLELDDLKKKQLAEAE